MSAGVCAKSSALLTTNIVGGLGNQLFLIANLMATSRRTHIPAFVEPVPFSSSAEEPRPTYWRSLFKELEQHGVQLRTPPAPHVSASSTTSAFSAPLSLPIVPVPEMRPVRKIELNARRSCIYNLVGFFQCAEFFDDFPVVRSVVPADLWRGADEHLKRYYSSPCEASHSAKDARNSIMVPSHRVALHVRRGDYTHFRDIFEQLEVDYYDAAVRQLLGGQLLYPRVLDAVKTSCGSGAHGRSNCEKEVDQTQGAYAVPGELHLLVFCDELRVAQTMAGYFRAKYRGIRVSVVHPDEEAKIEAQNNNTVLTTTTEAKNSPSNMPREVLELLMMARCNDVVMANSTFSWWGAYLNTVPLRRVIAPSKWFVKDPYPASNHLYCPGWMLI